MIKKIYVLISIILLSVLFVFQYRYLVKNTTADYILDHKINSFSNDLNYVLLSELTNSMLDEIEKTNDKNITFMFNKNTSPYSDGGIGFLMLKNEVLPLNMVTTTSIVNGYTFDDSIDVLSKIDLDYVLILGKNSKFYNYVTSNDYTLLEVNKKNDDKVEVKEIVSYNFGLIEIYENAVKNNNYTIINDLIDTCVRVVDESWIPSAISLLYYYSMDLYERGYYDEAIKISNIYLEHCDSINDEININMAKIYEYKNDYEKALYHYDMCLRNSACDETYVKSQISLLEKNGGV